MHGPGSRSPALCYAVDPAGRLGPRPRAHLGFQGGPWSTRLLARPAGSGRPAGHTPTRNGPSPGARVGEPQRLPPKPERGPGPQTKSGVNTYVIVLGATPFPPPHLRQNKVKFKIETNYLVSLAPGPRSAVPAAAQTLGPGADPRPPPATDPEPGLASTPQPREDPHPAPTGPHSPAVPLPDPCPSPRPPALSLPSWSPSDPHGPPSLLRCEVGPWVPVSFTSWVTVQACDVRST